jgi:hypothetical protein
VIHGAADKAPASGRITITAPLKGPSRFSIAGPSEFVTTLTHRAEGALVPHGVVRRAVELEDLEAVRGRAS